MILTGIPGIADMTRGFNIDAQARREQSHAGRMVRFGGAQKRGIMVGDKTG
jgi:hypothetical protein